MSDLAISANFAMQNYKKGNVKTVRNVKKIVVINGSPRRDGNTVRMTSAVVSGIRSLLPEVEILEFNLYDLNYTGCRNCFSCKVRNSSNYGKCVIKDDLASVLDRICKADGRIVGAVYLMDMFLGYIFSLPLRVCAYNTCQFDDYLKYVVETFSESEKAA